MEGVVSETRVGAYQKFYETNSTDASFPSRIPTTTAPSGNGVLVPPGSGLGGARNAPSAAMVVPYGVGADNTTFKIRIIGWRLIGTLYVPTILCEFTCTNSTAVGVAGATVVATERFADTLTANAFNPSGGVEAVSVANNTPAHFLVDCKGCQYIEATFDMNASATSANALVAWV